MYVYSFIFESFGVVFFFAFFVPHSHFCTVGGNLVLLIDGNLESNIIALPFSLFPRHKMWLVKAISISCEYRPMNKHPENHCVHVNYFVRALVKSQSRSRFHFIRSYKMLKLYQIDVNESWIFHVKHRTHRTLSAFQSFISIVLRTQRPGLFNRFSHFQCVDTVFLVATMRIAERFYPHYSTTHTRIHTKKNKNWILVVQCFQLQPILWSVQRANKQTNERVKVEQSFWKTTCRCQCPFSFPTPRNFSCHCINFIVFTTNLRMCSAINVHTAESKLNRRPRWTDESEGKIGQSLHKTSPQCIVKW